MYRNLAVLFALVSVVGLSAATTPTTSTTAAPAVTESVSTVAAPWWGFLEVRPTYGSKVGQFTTEDTVEVGYKFDADTKLYYSQWILTNMYTPGSETSGMNLVADEGALRANFDNIWTSGNTSVSYQARFHTPTNPDMRDAGFITTFRNYLKVAQKLNDAVSVDFSLSPWLFVYDRAGTAKGGVNPIFNQRFVLNADWKITDKLTLSVPLIADFTRNRDYSADVAFNNAWQYKVWAWPDLAYSLNEMHSLGLAYRSDNFIAADGSATTTADGFEKGVFQAYWGVNL